MLSESVATEMTDAMTGVFGALRHHVVDSLWRDSIDSGVAEVD